MKLFKPIGCCTSSSFHVTQPLCQYFCSFAVQSCTHADTHAKKKNVCFLALALVCGWIAGMVGRGGMDISDKRNDCPLKSKCALYVYPFVVLSMDVSVFKCFLHSDLFLEMYLSRRPLYSLTRSNLLSFLFTSWQHIGLTRQVAQYFESRSDLNNLLEEVCVSLALFTLKKVPVPCINGTCFYSYSVCPLGQIFSGSTPGRFKCRFKCQLKRAPFLLSTEKCHEDTEVNRF